MVFYRDLSNNRISTIERNALTGMRALRELLVAISVFHLKNTSSIIENVVYWAYKSFKKTIKRKDLFTRQVTD